MQWIWIFYWAFLVSSFLIGLVYFLKKKTFRWLGVVQSLFTLFFAVWAFAFAFQRDYLEQSEMAFLIMKIREGSIDAILLVLSFVLLMIVAIYHFIILLRKQ